MDIFEVLDIPRTGVPAYVLAGMADCATPDTPTSPGAQYLDRVARDVLDWWEDADADDRESIADYPHDVVAELGDQAVPIYTRDIWAAFVDLGAYAEDPTELGEDGSDMERAAAACLYLIGERLAVALLAELVEQSA